MRPPRPRPTGAARRWTAPTKRERSPRWSAWIEAGRIIKAGTFEIGWIVKETVDAIREEHARRRVLRDLAAAIGTHSGGPG